MKIFLEKADFLAALDRVRPTVSGSQMVQVFQCFCFKGDTVCTFNGNSGTITECKLNNMEFAVPADKFYRLISAMPRQLELEHKDTGVLHVKAGQNKTQMNTLPAKGFPPILPTDPTYWNHAGNFVEGLARVVFSVTDNATKPNLMGVGASGDYLWSSDGIRVSRFKLTQTVPSPLTIPKDACNHLAKLGQPEQFLRTGNNLMAWYPSTKTSYVTALIAQEFPFVIAEKTFNIIAGNIQATFPTELAEALDRVCLMSPSENADIILENTSGGLLISSGSEIGSGEELLPWDFKEPFRIAANPTRFKQAFNASQTVDLTNVTKGDKRMLLFKHSDGFEHLLALMSER